MKKPYRKPQLKTRYDEKNLCVRFDAKTWGLLDAAARRLNVTPSVLVRMAVANFGAKR